MYFENMRLSDLNPAFHFNFHCQF